MWFIIPLPRREFYWVKSREIRTKRGCIGDRNWFFDFCWGRSLLTAWVALVDSRTRSPKRWKPCSELHHAVMPPKQFTKWKCPLWKSGTSNIQSHTQQKSVVLRNQMILVFSPCASAISPMVAGLGSLRRLELELLFWRARVQWPSGGGARGFFIIWPIEIRYFIG